MLALEEVRGRGLVLVFHEEIGDDAVLPDVEAVNPAGGRADWLDTEIASPKDGGNGQFARETSIAELIFEGSDGHIGHFANGVIDDLVARGFEFGSGHAEQLAGGDRGELGPEIEIDETVDIADESDGPNNMGSGDFDGVFGGVFGGNLAMKTSL